MSYKEYLYNPSGGEETLSLKDRKVESPIQYCMSMGAGGRNEGYTELPGTPI